MKITVDVEICLTPFSMARPAEIKERCARLLEREFTGKSYVPGPLPLEIFSSDPMLLQNIEDARICEIENPKFSYSSTARSNADQAFLSSAPFWTSDLRFWVYQCNDDGPNEETTQGADESEPSDVSQFTQWSLPAQEFEGLWESLVFSDLDATPPKKLEPSSKKDGAEGPPLHAGSKRQSHMSSDPTDVCNSCLRPFSKEGTDEGVLKKMTNDQDLDHLDDKGLHGPMLKNSLLRYVESTLHFADKGVDTNVISWNQVVLLHGPPGTGKTTLSKALGQKLSIRMSHRYPTTQFIEINAHSLFSRWFSESGKLVHRLFSHIREIVEDEECLVILLIDEVESLTAARQAAVSGSEPGDAVRVVNAVLTAIDSFRNKHNVLLITTSNISEAIDIAFVDRADIKAYIGYPGILARYEILRSCVNELFRTGILVDALENGDDEEKERMAEDSTLPKHRILAPLDHGVLHTSHMLTKIYGTGQLEAQDFENEKLETLLLHCAALCTNMSGRALRKLPLQVFIQTFRPGQNQAIRLRPYLAALYHYLTM